MAVGSLPAPDPAAGGIQGSHTVQVRARRCRGRRRVWHLPRRCFRDLDELSIDLKGIGNNLRNLCVQSLPHFGSTVIEVY